MDKIQKGLGEEVDEGEAKKLQKEKLIEGRRPNYILSMKVPEILDQKADYINKKKLESRRNLGKKFEEIFE